MFPYFLFMEQTLIYYSIYRQESKKQKYSDNKQQLTDNIEVEGYANDTEIRGLDIGETKKRLVILIDITNKKIRCQCRKVRN